jgi:HrpA-like helicases
MHNNSFRTSRSGFWKPSGFASQNFLQHDGDDPSEENSNVIPFNFQTIPLSMQRQCLPIAKHRTQLLYAMEYYSVVVLVGETGSGKSTQIPQYLFENGWCDQGFAVCCTQPRRIAAQTLAQRVSQEMGTELGRTVGYSIRFDVRTSPETAIKYCTDGMLLRETTLIDPLLSRYSVIIIDEAHELNCNTEILLGVIKKIRKKRKDLRVIVCSATIDAEAFLDFFISPKARESEAAVSRLSLPRKKRKRWGIAANANDCSKGESSSSLQEDESMINIENRGTIISIDGRQHPVDILYSVEAVADYVNATVESALQIHFEEDLNTEDGDILCFLATGEEIDRAIKIAQDRVDSMGPRNGMSVSSQLVFLPLYGTLPYHLQSRVFQPKVSNDKRRRIIFATNIAETSVTVPHIASVIDCGFVKLPYFDPKSGFDRLIVR